jgi:ABC-2 type transport system ATP-binding protein
VASADIDTRARADTGSAPDPASAPAVELIDLTKFYPGRRAADGTLIPAVDHVNIQIQYGEVYGLLGPNGAGKSTIVRMIATLLAPTSGQVWLCGMDARRQERRIRAILGVALGGERSLYWKLTARQNLEYFAALYGQSRRQSRGRIVEVLAEMDLADRADDHIETWSTGMRQRLVIARALLNRPKVLLLDEPSSGLDPRAAQTMQDHIRALKAAGNTILLTTHDMLEADSLSDRIGIIDSGKVAAEGTPTQLKRSIGASQVVHARIAFGSPQQLDLFVADLVGVAEATIEQAVPPEGGPAEVALRGGNIDDLVPAVIAAAGRHGGSVLRVENDPVNLKDAFLALTGRRLTGEPDQT